MASESAMVSASASETDPAPAAAESPLPQASPAVTTKGLTRRFGRFTALSGVNFTVPTGAILGLLGPNGSGKTTLLSILTGFISPTEGTFSLLGESKHRLALARTGSLISRPLMWPHLSCRDNLRCVQGVHTGGQDPEEVERLLAQVGLSGPSASRKFSQCSTGMKLRLGIAGALVNNPELLILDEPTNGLDPEGMVEVREIILELGRTPGRTIIMSSHQLNEVERTCDHYAIINRGILAAQGRIGEAPASADAPAIAATMAPATATTMTSVTATTIATTDNAEALRYLIGKGWAAEDSDLTALSVETTRGEEWKLACDLIGKGWAASAEDSDLTALSVETTRGEEWKLACDLDEISIFPTAMRPAAPEKSAGTSTGTTTEALAGTLTGSLEEIYLSVVRQGGDHPC